jgi:phosphate-selective porin OprO/OprP
MTFWIAANGGSNYLANAQETDAPRAAGDAARVASLEEKLRVIEARLERLESMPAEKDAALVASNGAIPSAAVSAQRTPSLASVMLPPAAPQTPASPTVGAGPEGFSIQSATGDFKLGIRFQMNVDGRFAADPHSEPNSFFVRRAQPILDATLYKRFFVHVLTDFGQGKQRIHDAYFDITFAPWLKLRIGKMKGPVGLERLMSGQTTPFMERAFPTQLLPNRDIGLQIYGDLPGARLSYAVGVFDGVPDVGSTDGDTEDHKEFEGRVFALPFHGSGLHLLEGLGIGIGGTYGEAGPAMPQYSTSGQRVFFQPGVPPMGIHYRISPQGYYYFGPFGLMGEYAMSAQDYASSAGPPAGRKPIFATLKNAAWQVQTSFVLTGEDASYNGVTPSLVFDPSKGTWGAFELAARYDVLRIDRATFPNFVLPEKAPAATARAWAFGLNWYFNRNVRWMFDFERTDFDRSPNFPPDTRLDPERVFLQRFQLRF